MEFSFDNLTDALEMYYNNQYISDRVLCLDKTGEVVFSISPVEYYTGGQWPDCYLFSDRDKTSLGARSTDRILSIIEDFEIESFHIKPVDYKKGINKIVEECGEVVQVLSKMQQPWGDKNKLYINALEEMADLKATIKFHTSQYDDYILNKIFMRQRVKKKKKRFMKWDIDGNIS